MMIQSHAESTLLPSNDHHVVILIELHPEAQSWGSSSKRSRAEYICVPDLCLHEPVAGVTDQHCRGCSCRHHGVNIGALVLD